jgi:hypothetical protein
MDIYRKLIDDPLFFKWIFHPSPEVNDYWKNYLDLHRDEAEMILEFKEQIIQYFKYEGKILSDFEKKALAKKIILNLETTGRKKVQIHFIRTFMKYAATALIFFAIGGSLVFLYMEGRQSRVVMDTAVLPATVHDPVLILGDREQIALNKGESKLEYSEDGELTLNREQKIQVEIETETPEMNTLVIPYGNRSVITLADGSKVWLNAGSRLIYPSKFVDKTREVFLTGEAFFDITKNEKQLFVVKTVDVKVQVLGTRFNVSAYPEDYSVQTVVADGTVEIKKVNAGLFDKAVRIAPGHLGYFNKKTQQTEVSTVDIDQYTLWTEGLFKFSNTDFSRIIKKLERYYNIRFQLDDPFKGTIQISGKLDVTKGRDEVFEYLSRLTGLEFIKINDSHYMIK